MKLLIDELKKKAYSENSLLWSRIAKDLEKPTRQRREVNLSRINMHAKDNEIIVVPGKVLATGELSQKLTIAAWRFSKQAVEKIERAKSKAVSISELMNDNIKGKGVRIIG